MKIIALLVALLATTSVSACGSIIVDQPFPYVPLSSFGMNSSFNTIIPKNVKKYNYDLSRCISPEARGGSRIPNQKFPSVLLSEFNMNSWKVAK